MGDTVPPICSDDAILTNCSLLLSSGESKLTLEQVLRGVLGVEGWRGNGPVDPLGVQLGKEPFGV